MEDKRFWKITGKDFWKMEVTDFGKMTEKDFWKVKDLLLIAGLLLYVLCFFAVVFYLACEYTINQMYKLFKILGLLKLVYFGRHMLDVLKTCVFSPSLVIRYIKLEWTEKQVRLDMDQYYKDICMDSDYPDQIQFHENSWRYTEQSGPVTLARSFPAKNKCFDFEKLSFLALERFVEILPSVTLHYFSKTSKIHYYICLDYRGFEYCLYDVWDKRVEYLGDMLAGYPTWDFYNASKNGRLIGSSANIYKRRQELSKYVVCSDMLRLPANHLYEFKAHIKCYRQLLVKCEKYHFGAVYNQIIDNFVHDGVDTIKLYSFKPDTTTLQDLITFFKKCPKVTKFGCSFNLFTSYLSNNQLINFDRHFWSRFLNDPPIQEIKAELEKWFITRPDLIFFKLIYCRNGFLLHDQKLKLMERFCRKNWFLTDDYTERTLPGKHDVFFQELEYPYDFMPPRIWTYYL